MRPVTITLDSASDFVEALPPSGVILNALGHIDPLPSVNGRLADVPAPDLAILRARADKANQKLPSFTLKADVRFATAAARKEFTEELATEVAKLVAKHHDEKAPAGRLFRFFVGAYPVITKQE